MPDGKRSPKDMLMGYHMRLGHMPFDRLQQAAKQGYTALRDEICGQRNKIEWLLNRIGRLESEHVSLSASQQLAALTRRSSSLKHTHPDEILLNLRR
jgi:hypothetical protein